MSSRTMTQTAAKVAPKVLLSQQKSSMPSTNRPANAHSLLSSFVPKQQGRIVTQVELANNCGVGSESGMAWIALHGHVFDITEFTKSHPGGQSIRLAAGRDGTCLVESYHPSTSIPKVEAALFNRTTYIGLLQTDETEDQTKPAPVKTYTRPNDAFFQDVRAKVEAFIDQDSHRYAFEMIGLVEALVTFLIYSYACYQVAVHGSWWWTLALGFLTGRMGFLMHMGNHCGISRSPKLNQLIGWFMDLAGSNATIWGYEHQVAHHGEPNEYHKDNDCEIGNPHVRMHPEIPHNETQRYQHIIVPIAMTIGFFKWYVGDFSHFSTKQVGNVRMAIDGRDWAQMLAFKALWMSVHVIIPIYFNGYALALTQLLVFMGLGGHYLENIFIVNHIQNGLVPPPTAHWAAKQVMATTNWKSGSNFWNWFSGGLNHQIEHHMFPSLSYWWYSRISHIVRQCCLDHQLPYEDYPNWSSAWIAMITYLRDMGDPHFISKQGQKGAPPMVEISKVHAA
jgi:fatty acid desaturase/predicted heme/steroid binding protein